MGVLGQERRAAALGLLQAAAEEVTCFRALVGPPKRRAQLDAGAQQCVAAFGVLEYADGLSQQLQTRPSSLDEAERDQRRADHGGSSSGLGKRQLLARQPACLVALSKLEQREGDLGPPMGDRGVAASDRFDELGDRQEVVERCRRISLGPPQAATDVQEPDHQERVQLLCLTDADVRQRRGRTGGSPRFINMCASTRATFARASGCPCTSRTCAPSSPTTPRRHAMS